MKAEQHIFSFSTEELRTELCMYNLKLFQLKKSQILDKFLEIKLMLEKQEKYHKIWNK